MRILAVDASEAEIKNVLVEWTELMAQERYADALALIPYDNLYCYEDNEWTPELLESVVYGYGLAGYTREEILKDFGCLYKITSLNDMVDKDEILDSIEICYDCKWFKGNDIAEIWYDVPLNGEQSDLTGRFLLRLLDEQHMTLVFEDLHVM
ncbi:MAG: hypothetical protein K2M91_05625 [Lachnospiraceae bacterium]|nr:hypothetical protein [Lachnospiraceae bacterium]